MSQIDTCGCGRTIFEDDGYSCKCQEKDKDNDIETTEEGEENESSM